MKESGYKKVIIVYKRPSAWLHRVRVGALRPRLPSEPCPPGDAWHPLWTLPVPQTLPACAFPPTRHSWWHAPRPAPHGRSTSTHHLGTCAPPPRPLHRPTRPTSLSEPRVPVCQRCPMRLLVTSGLIVTLSAGGPVVGGRLSGRDAVTASWPQAI